MLRKIVLFAITLSSIVATTAHGQDIIYAGLKNTPLGINPAFTGMSNGSVRANVTYNNYVQEFGPLKYRSVTASVDLPVFTSNNGSFFAAGMKLNRGSTSDNYLVNFSSLVSVAYHQCFGKRSDSNGHHNSYLSVGLQAGYNQSTQDLYDLYFGAPYYQPVTVLHIGLGNSVNYYPVNIGMCFTHAAGDNFNYTVGVAGYNLNQHHNEFEYIHYMRQGNSTAYIGLAGFDWTIFNRVTLRPEIIYQNMRDAEMVIAGSEFAVRIGKNDELSKRWSVFTGGWYNAYETVLITGGVEHMGLRAGIAFDYHYSSMSSNGFVEGIGVSLTYTAPGLRHSRHSTGFQ